MKFFSIASSSKGNSSYLETKNVKALIDVGISYTKIKNALKEIGVDISKITHVFITHEHTDHINGLKMLLKHYSPKVYLTKGTNSHLKLQDVNIIKGLEEVVVGDLSVLPIPLSHDAKEAVGFVFKSHGKSICYITDTGYILNELTPLLENHTLYFLESNYDPFTLIHSERPYHLKKRIIDEKGHLSNEESAYYFSTLKGDKTKYLVHSHISEECNTFDKIKETFDKVLQAQGEDMEFKRYYALPNESMELIIL
ncbi:MAG: MBL fold metallo-hydrolase [Acholeplasmatales bacterium]